MNIITDAIQRCALQEDVKEIIEDWSEWGERQTKETLLQITEPEWNDIIKAKWRDENGNFRKKGSKGTLNGINYAIVDALGNVDVMIDILNNRYYSSDITRKKMLAERFFPQHYQEINQRLVDNIINITTSYPPVGGSYWSRESDEPGDSLLEFYSNSASTFTVLVEAECPICYTSNKQRYKGCVECENIISCIPCFDKIYKCPLCRHQF